MKTLLKLSLGLLLLVSVAAHAELKPYIGLNMQFHHMKFQSPQSKLNHANSPQGNFIVGLNVLENLAVEAGYNVMSWDFRSYQRFHTFAYGKATGVDHHLKGPHLDLVGSLPLSASLKLIASVGVAHLRSKWHVEDMGDALEESHVKHRVLYRAGAGFRYAITESVALKGMVGMMDTRKLTFQSKQIEIKPRANHYTSVGVELGF
jgi:opacity protein-like surface antigen